MPEIRIIVPDAMDNTLNKMVSAGYAGNKAEIVRMALTQFISANPALMTRDYDHEVIFTPEGRIMQLEYAVDASKKGNLAVGVCAKDGLVLIKRTSMGLTLKNIIENPQTRYGAIQHIGKMIAITHTGLANDAFLIVKEAQNYAESLDPKTPLDISRLIDHLALFIHSYTLKKECRVLGAMLLVAGLDLEDRPKLFHLEPYGLASDYYAYAMGSQEKDSALNYLAEQELSSLKLNDAIKLGLKAASQNNFDVEFLCCEVLDLKTKEFRELTLEEKKAFL